MDRGLGRRARERGYSIVKERRVRLPEEAGTVEGLAATRRGDYTTKIGNLQPKVRGFLGWPQVLGGPGVGAVRVLWYLLFATGCLLFVVDQSGLPSSVLSCLLKTGLPECHWIKANSP